jgi:hypothetical protein
VPGPDSYKI